MTIYENIKKLAVQKNISIRELENRLGYSNGSLRKWEYSAPSNRLKEVADFFNVSVDYLINTGDEKSTQILGRKMDKLSEKQINAINSLLDSWNDND